MPVSNTAIIRCSPGRTGVSLRLGDLRMSRVLFFWSGLRHTLVDNGLADGASCMRALSVGTYGRKITSRASASI